MFREKPATIAPQTPGLLDFRVKEAVKKIAKVPKKPAKRRSK